MPKPYDSLFKTLAEGDPRGLLHLFGALSLEAEAEVWPVDRELQLPLLAVDHAYRVRHGGREWLIHLEAQTRYEAAMGRRLALYGGALALKFELPIQPILVLLAERNVPLHVPEEAEARFGSVCLQTRYQVVKVWEIEAAQVLDLERPSLLPWVTLMRSGEQEIEEAARRIRRSGDARAAAEFVVLGGLRYDREAAMLGRVRAMLSEEMIRESSYVQMLLEEGLEKGLEKGREEGLEKGSLEEARRNVRLVWELRFPDLTAPPELDAIMNREHLESVLAQIVTASDVEGARSAFREAIAGE